MKNPLLHFTFTFLSFFILDTGQLWGDSIFSVGDVQATDFGQKFTFVTVPLGLIWSERKDWLGYHDAYHSCRQLGARLPNRDEVHSLIEDFGAKRIGFLSRKFDRNDYRPQIFSDISHEISDERKPEYSQQGIWYDDQRDDSSYGVSLEWYIHLESLTFWYSTPDSLMSFRCVK
jgi:hypothetical protein